MFTFNIRATTIGDLLIELLPQLWGASYLHFFKEELITWATGGCTIGNVTNCVAYAWWSSCSFYLWRKAVFWLAAQIDGWMKHTGFVASTITRSTPANFYLWRPCEGHSLHEKSQHVAGALAFYSSGCDNSKICAWNSSVCIIGHHLWRVFSGTFVNIL
jgi:hypothetical protein